MSQKRKVIKNLDNLREALSDLSDSLENISENKEALVNLARAWEQLEKIAEAIEPQGPSIIAQYRMFWINLAKQSELRRFRRTRN